MIQSYAQILCTNHFKTVAGTSLGAVDNRIDQAGVIPTTMSPTKLAADTLMLGNETTIWAQHPWFWVLGPVVHTVALESP
jgi:hypothetical protein